MKPTRRGYAALAVVVGAFFFAWAGDPGRARALNAIAAPVLAAVVAGAVTVHRAGALTVERTEPTPGSPARPGPSNSPSGRRRRHYHRLHRRGPLRGGHLRPVAPTTVEYEVTYDQRGVHRLGRTIVRVRDVLGLVETVHRLNETTAVLVYPRVYAVGDPGSFLRTLGPESDERTEFDRLREYVPGDSLRDVHWKSSAKREDLLVTEFTDPADEEAVSIAASADSRYADDMATAAATLFVAAVSVGLTVDLSRCPVAPSRRGHGETHKRHALELLAHTGSGTVPDHAWERADVRISADGSGVTVAVDDQIYSLDDLTATRGEPGPGGGGAVTLVGRVRENRAVEAVDWPRAMALFAVLATLGAALQVMYHFIDVVGLPLAFLAIVAISLVAATALARVLPAWTAVVVAVVPASRSAWAGT